MSSSTSEIKGEVGASFVVSIVEEPGFKNVKNKHLGMSPF